MEFSSENILIKGGIALKNSGEGSWISKWQDWNGELDSVELNVFAALDMFEKQTIESIVKGEEKPFTDAEGIVHDWDGRDAIHLITSSDEGRTWSNLNEWFDGTPIAGMPYEDGEQHSEPGLYFYLDF